MFLARNGGIRVSPNRNCQLGSDILGFRAAFLHAANLAGGVGWHRLVKDVAVII